MLVDNSMFLECLSNCEGVLESDGSWLCITFIALPSGQSVCVCVGGGGGGGAGGGGGGGG